ncbi:MAG: hypothetical protein KKD07_02810 [Candidatus Omnitrophica bacterium]|nr:hypothetical protein [Candidatus Omnitrophota bacterium]MBU1997628.1 hypothetical protein [Candidatus Omnitrophota bacterium]MBU4333352.1 hypothetical protein [Candidatus Omnitrophota bacterium]
MVRKLIVLTLLVALTATSSIAFAADVYVTKNGKKYHDKECLLIKNKEATAKSKEDAIETGYTPCRRCFKEDVIVEEKYAVDKDAKLKEKK